MVKNLPTTQETQVDPWVGNIPWRRACLPTPVLLPGESYGQRILAGYSPWGCKQSDISKHAHTHSFSPRGIDNYLCLNSSKGHFFQDVEERTLGNKEAPQHGLSGNFFY